MAAPPKLRRLAMEDFKDASAEMRPVVEKLVGALNPFLSDVSFAVDKRLTVRDNMAAAYRTVNATVPDNVWTAPTLNASWVTYNAATHNTVGYRISESGRVYVRGEIKDGTVAAGTVLFTLPAGYRPTRTHVFATVSNGAFCEVNVEADGDVVIQAGANANSLSLDNVSFDAVAPAAAPPAFVGSGWPIVLRPEDEKGRKIGLSVTDVQLVRAVDVNGNVATSHGAGNVDWTLDAGGQVVVRRVTGVSPGRSYRLTFRMLGG